MIVNAKEFAGLLKAARAFASKDTTRAFLNCLRLEAVDNALRVVATDGHTLFCAEIAATDVDDNDASPWHMSLEDADTLIKRAKSYVTADLALTTHTAWGMTFRPRFKDDEAKFPPYTQVLPESHELTSEASAGFLPYSAAYIARAADAFATLGAALHGRTRLIPVAWRETATKKDGCKPLVVWSNAVPNAIAVIMPINGDLEEKQAAAFVDRVRGVGAETKAAA